MLKKILHNGKVLYDNLIEYYVVSVSRKRENKKFDNPQRDAIQSEVILTKEQKKIIDKLYENNYGKKVGYKWHRFYTAFTGNFDENYFPELLFIPEFERYMNLDKEYCKVFADKNVLPVLAKSVGIKTPKTFLSCIKGNYRIGETCVNKTKAIEVLQNVGEVFLKPSVDSCSGQGCLIANFVDGSDTLSGKSMSEIFDALGTDFVVQERVKCHSEISDIYDGSVNTIRIMTYRWKEELRVALAIMRIGQGNSYLDNVHAGGMFIAIDNDGTLHKTAYTEFKQEFNEHPNSKLKFEGYKINLFPKVVEAAKKMHDAIPQVGVVNWDFTIDESGEPLLIEANLHGGGIGSYQKAHGRGLFGNDTKDILQWLRKMKNTKKADQKYFRFGNMVK